MFSPFIKNFVYFIYIGIVFPFNLISIDLREILSEEMFNEAKKDILYKENK